MNKLYIPEWVNEIKIEGKHVICTHARKELPKHYGTFNGIFNKTFSSLPPYGKYIIQLPKEITGTCRFLDDQVNIVTYDNIPYNKITLKGLLKGELG